MFWELLLGLLAVLIICDTIYKRRRRNLLLKAGIGGPKPLPLLGNAIECMGNDTANIFNFLSQMRQKHGKIYCLWAFHHNVLIVQDPKYLEGFLKSQQVITKNVLYDLLEAWLGRGLLLSTGAKWFARRKIITPAFHFKILEQFVEIFDQQSHIMVKRLEKKADGKTAFNMFPEVCLTALDIIAETAMGVKVQAQEHPEFTYAKAVTDAANIVAQRFMTPVGRFDWHFRIFKNKSYRRLKKSIKIMHDFTDKVIEERRDALQESIKNGSYQEGVNVINDMGIKKRMAFLDVLLQSTISGKPLSNKDIREEVDTFMFEGHDTTTSGISFTLYLLARHPEIQQKVFQEIREVIGDDKDGPVTMQQLQELKYLDCVIKESLRLYPPVPMIGRVNENEAEINGYTLSPGTNAILLLYAACRDPDYFPQPDEFVPERFSNSENAEQTNPFAYVPFSAGPRNCIGQKFAVLEMKSTISKMLRHFELLPLGEDAKLVMSLILRSVNGVNMGLRPRIYYINS